MAYNPNNPNGVAASANSAPVVTASDDANLKGFAAAAAGGYVRQDSTGTIAKESGGNLATLAGAVSSSKVNVNISSGNPTSIIAVGNAASGSAVAGAPVLTGGSDGTNARTLATNTGGDLLLGGGGTNVPIKDDTNYGDGVTTGILSTVSRLYNTGTTSYDRPHSVAQGIQGVGINDGTNTANVGTADSGNNFLFMGGVPKTDSISLSAGSQSSAWYDLAMYPSFSLEILTNASGNTLSFQTSSDAAQTNVTGTILMVSSTNNGAGVSSSSSATATLSGSRTGRYFRVSSTLSGGNTATLTLTRYTIPHFFPIVGGQVNATQSGSWTVGSNSATGSAVPANAFYMGVLGSSGNLIALGNANISGDGSGATNALSSATSIYNGSNYDRQRNNNTASLIAAGTTSTQSAVALTTYNARLLTLVINITVATAATLTVAVSGASSSSYTYSLGSSAALATISTNTLMFGPGLPATANASFNVPLPRNVQVTATVTGTCTYGIDYILSV